MRLETTDGGEMRRWPDAVAYREAIQTPGIALGDPALRDAHVQLNRQDLPLAYSGRFAVVFRLTDQSHNDWALRCFTTPDSQAVVRRSIHYSLLSRYIDTLADLFVPYRYASRGIRVAGQWYPTLAMRWAEGATLGRWVEKNLDRPDRLLTLSDTLGALLKRLEDAGIAHGDWQHDNLIVSEDGSRVTLVDYDGMFVPELAGYPAPELGHPNYQHPARTERHFGVGLDRFACLSIQTALLALARHPQLWERYGGEEQILFTKDDFRAPEQSRLVAALRETADEALADSLARLLDACAHAPEVAAHEARPLPAEPPRVPKETPWFVGEAPAAQAVAPPEERVSFLAQLPARATDRLSDVVLLVMFAFTVAIGMVGALYARDIGLGIIALAVGVIAFLISRSVHQEWSVLKLRRELDDAIERLEAPIRRRREALDNIGEAEFLRERMEAASLWNLEPGRGLPATDAQALARLGYHSGAALWRKCDASGKLPAAILADAPEAQAWLDRRLAEAREEFWNAPERQGLEAHCAQVLLEIEELDKAVAPLRAEREAFPDTSFRGWLAWTFGR